MKDAIPWLYSLAAVVVLNIVVSLFMNRVVRRLRMPLILAAYLVGIVLFFKLGVSRALILWCGIGISSGFLYWGYECWSARRSEELNTRTPSLITVVHGLLAWPIMLPEVIEYSWAELFPGKKTTIDDLSH